MKNIAIPVLLGILLLACLGGCGTSPLDVDLGECDVCGRQIHKATLYRIHLEGGDVRLACCPRCGLRSEEGEEVQRREVADFYSGEMIQAQDAYYVEGGSVHLCCSTPSSQRDRAGRQYELHFDRCLPSLVAFQTLEEARRFSSQEGGAIKVFPELLPAPAHP